MTTLRGISTVAIAAGICLFIASWFWPQMVGGRRVWSDEQARKYADTLADMHRLGGEAAHAQELAKQQAAAKNPAASLAESKLSASSQTGTPVDPATATADRLTAELDRVKKEYQSQRAALDDARSYGTGAATIMRWLGITAVLAGGIGILLPSSGHR